MVKVFGIFVIDAGAESNRAIVMAVLADATCDICESARTGRAPEKDGWYSRGTDYHEYRTYYYALCSICETRSYSYDPGELIQHTFEYNGVNWHQGTSLKHVFELRCTFCGAVRYSVVEGCPGADWGGCVSLPARSILELISE